MQRQLTSFHNPSDINVMESWNNLFGLHFLQSISIHLGILGQFLQILHIVSLPVLLHLVLLQRSFVFSETHSVAARLEMRIEGP